MKSNFLFLKDDFPVLYEITNYAESYLYSDSNSCIIKLGMFAETLVRFMFRLDNISEVPEDSTHANRIRRLKREGMLPKEVDNILYALRRNRNDASHELLKDLDIAKQMLPLAHHLACWFMQVYGQFDFIPPHFSLPLEQVDMDRQEQQAKDALIEEQNQKIQQLEAQSIDGAERLKKIQKATAVLNLTETDTRFLIDEQLRNAGWLADSKVLKYSNGTRPEEGKNLAIAEWQTDSSTGKNGRADYALFIGLKLVGIVEAKRDHKDISVCLDNQCKNYASHIKKEHECHCISSWHGFQVPFLFATNGNPYRPQYPMKSGIWFQDIRNQSNIASPLEKWFEPQELETMLKQDIDKANRALSEKNYDLLRDPDGLSLHYYQIEAIEAVEAGIIAGKQQLLLAMATGTGKTRTVLGLIYRLLKHERFRRILFLVDRTSLGSQAESAFTEVQLEDLKKLDKIYTVSTLEHKDFDPHARVQIATVQGMVRKILTEEGKYIPKVGDYDLIIVDEAHRGYILDKDMDETEEEYRNHQDFMSKYRMVIEYFLCVKVALTATPAKQTVAIFGEPIYTYSYRQAVLDNFLVDHDAPHVLKTQLSQKGILFQKGEQVPIINSLTGEIENSHALPDEVSFSVDYFNRKVVTENFNRTVLTEISKYIDPEGEEKTLIFAQDRDHADMIVHILQEIYSAQDVPALAIKKITGDIGDKDYIDTEIKKFRNEQFPNIVVTVDLLTTGIDIPKICNLVFLRRVKSRILFEQMLGRATRKCDSIQKSHFEIYDPVGVYGSLEPVSNMKPVVQNASQTMGEVVESLETCPTEAGIVQQVSNLIGKINRKQKAITKEHAKTFTDLNQGKSLEEFTKELASLPPEKAREFVLEKTNRALLKFLDQCTKGLGGNKIISNHEDSLVGHERGFGEGQKPEDYLDEFEKFVKENPEKLSVLNLVCTAPSSLTHQDLKALRAVLDQHHFTETQLNTALKTVTKEEITADIITIIRNVALGFALTDHEERIMRAVKKLRKNHSFTKMQDSWLGRIEQHLLAENILTEETFQQGAFQSKGGFAQMNRIFDEKLKEYIIELNEYLYEDGGQAGA